MENTTPKILQMLRENKGWTKTEVARRLGITTVSTYANWEYGIRTPDKDMLSRIASLYGVSTDFLINGKVNSNSKSDLPSLSERDEKDIAKRLEEIREDIEHTDGLSFNGEPLSEEAKESFLEAMEFVVRQTKKINKKYAPNKYKKENDNGSNT